MGPWGVAAIVAVLAGTTETGRAYGKKALKSAIRLGFRLKDEADELVVKASEYRQEILDEVETEKRELAKVARNHKDGKKED